MDTCKHPAIVQVYGLCDIGRDTSYIVMELSQFGPLSSVLYDSTTSIPVSVRLAWIMDIASAMDHLHRLRIIHRDIKAENVLVMENLSCKLNDFGLSKEQNTSSSMGSTKQVGTLIFMAPEIITSGKYSHRSDVYAFGITMIQILDRYSPHGTISELIRRAIRFVPQDMKADIENFLTLCLAEANMRISAADCVIKAGRLVEVYGDPRDTMNQSHPDRLQVDTIIRDYINKFIANLNNNSNNSNSNTNSEVKDTIPISNNNSNNNNVVDVNDVKMEYYDNEVCDMMISIYVILYT
jgi:serine/threonine protein kinase